MGSEDLVEDHRGGRCVLRAGPYSQPDRLGACWEERKDLSYEYAIRGYRSVQARGVRGELAPAARGKAACTPQLGDPRNEQLAPRFGGEQMAFTIVALPHFPELAASRGWWCVYICRLQCQNYFKRA